MHITSKSSVPLFGIWCFRTDIAILVHVSLLKANVFSNLELLCHSFNLSQWNITLLKIYSALIINITSFGEGEYPFHPTYKLSICQSCKEKISITPVVCKHFLYVYCHAPSLPRRNMWFRTMSEPKLTLSLAYDKHTEI